MRDEVVRPDQVKGGLVGVVEALAADLSVLVANTLHGLLVVLGALVAAHAGEPAEGLLS